MTSNFSISNFHLPFHLNIFRLPILRNKMENGRFIKWKIDHAFTLVELLIVISILGVLASIALVSFVSAQQRGRDAARKSDLKQVFSALELYYSDYEKYPGASNTGLILACPSTTQADCVWEGTAAFSDTKTTYMKSMPKDPVSGQTYFYRIVDSPDNQKYQLYAHLENARDINCLPPSCDNPTLPTGFSTTACGSSGECNFSITSSNTTPVE